MGNRPINGVDFDGKWFWEKKHIRQARQYARQTGGEFHKYKGSDGKNWASVQDKSGYTSTYTNADGVTLKEYNITTQVFKPGVDKSNLPRATGKNSYDIDLTTKSGFEYMKGLAIKGDAWARGSGEFYRNGQAPGIMKAVANLNPAIGLTNDVISIRTKTDMYGEDASSKFDQTTAWIGVFAAIPGYESLIKTLGVAMFGANVAKNAATVGKTLDYAETSVGFADDAGYLDSIK